MRYYNPLASIASAIILAIPFLPQLKVIMDWAFVKTSLNLFQWFQLEDFQQVFYSSKMNMKALTRSRVGQRVACLKKFCMGWFCQFIILLVIFLPMILFSSLNKMGFVNPIISMQFTVGLASSSAQFGT